MKKVSSKILALLLSLTVIFSMMPGMAMADGGAVYTVDVKVRVHDGYEFKYINNELTVTSDMAEKYGYEDKCTDQVSALDVLVAAHKAEFGDAFTPETAENFLTMSGGNPQAMFQNNNATKLSGFAVNHSYYKDEDGLGYNVNTAPIEDADVIDFFYYEDPYWMDYLNWFEDVDGNKIDYISVAAGEPLKLKVKGYVFMNGYTDPTPDVLGSGDREDYFQILNADKKDICYFDIEKDETVDGVISITFDEPGTYNLTTTGFDENGGSLIPAYLTVSVNEMAPISKDPVMYLDNNPYDGASDINVTIGSTHTLTGYITDDNWSVYDSCYFDAGWSASGLGIDASAVDETYGYGASMTFKPTSVGTYKVSLKDNNGAVKTFNIIVSANDLRGLSSGTLDFYSDPTYGESSMLGNNWCKGNELTALPDETPESMRADYRYLSAYVVSSEGKEYKDMTVNWYYSDTYSASGKNYKKVATSGESSVNDNITYYNGAGWAENTSFFNIYPDTTKPGTYYYYVTVSDGKNTISSVTNQAVVNIGTKAAGFDGIGNDDLKFYSNYGFDYSMLGNNWYAGKELKADVNTSVSDLEKDYKYIAADINAIDGKELSDYTVTWYYGDTYKADGAGYTEVATTTTGASSTEKYGKQLKGTSGNVSYQYTDMRSAVEYPADYYDLRIYPDITKAGTYYYYVVISDGVNTLSSVTSQAMVVISAPTVTPSTPSGDITATFTLKGYGDLSGFSATSSTVADGSTAGELFKKVMDSKGYTYDGLSSNYVKSVTKGDVTLAEFDYGPNSGWMYTVNGAAPSVGMNSYVLSNNDNVVFYYTPDWTKDQNAINSMPTANDEPKVEIKDTDGNAATDKGTIKYDATTGTLTITPAEGYQVADVIVNGISKGAVTSLTGLTKDDVVEIKFEAASATDPVVDNSKIIKGVKATTVTASTKKTSKGIKSTWTKSKGYKVDKYQIYRSTSGKKGTFKRVYTTKKSTTKSYTNKKLKKGKKYYYKVRGVRKIDGKNYYTKWSNVSKRTFK